MLLHTVERRACVVGLNPSAVFIIGPTSLVVGHASHAPGRSEVMAGGAPKQGYSPQPLTFDLPP